MDRPGLRYYGETDRQDFPLLLIISRAPLNADAASSELGTYDFDEERNGLWNGSYRLLASVNDTEPAAIKAVCRQRVASPILFADCSRVKPLLHTAGTSDADAPEEIGLARARSVLSHDAVVNRVAVVAFSGVDGTEFEASRNGYHAALLEHGIPWFNTRYLFGTNLPRVLDGLGAPARTKLGWVYRRFSDWANASRDGDSSLTTEDQSR